MAHSDIKTKQRLSFGRIKLALQDIENQSSYYIGGSLCIDFKDHPCVVLNRNGRGFAYWPKLVKPGKTGHISFLATKEIEALVNAIYARHKGNSA